MEANKENLKVKVNETLFLYTEPKIKGYKCINPLKNETLESDDYEDFEEIDFKEFELDDSTETEFIYQIKINQEVDFFEPHNLFAFKGNNSDKIPVIKNVSELEELYSGLDKIREYKSCYVKIQSDKVEEFKLWKDETYVDFSDFISPFQLAQNQSEFMLSDIIELKTYSDLKSLNILFPPNSGEVNISFFFFI